jgi:hypothetical protein
MGRSEKSEPTAEEKEWDDMSTGQKIVSVFEWPVQWALLIGGSSLAGHGL